MCECVCVGLCMLVKPHITKIIIVSFVLVFDKILFIKSQSIIYFYFFFLKFLEWFSSDPGKSSQDGLELLIFSYLYPMCTTIPALGCPHITLNVVKTNF